jgi:cell division protein FtsL
MSRFVVVALLWVGCLLSALGVVYETHQARIATAQLESSRREMNQLQVESGQLSLERSSLAAYARVESVAVGQLKMVNPQNMRFVPLPKDAL